MPPDMAISMRHSKITAKEAALLAGELNKPSWESRNEGIHERVSFEDTIWGFDLAGGLFYKTPLRVTFVKPDSRADKAGIRPGDKLKRINDIDTSTLTIQEAHDIILESGVHIKLAVTAPEDEEDSYNCYEDPIDEAYDSDEERRREEEKAKKRQVHARVSHYWSLQWPWVSKRRIIYRESNCFMVPSNFEEKHRDKFPIQPRIRIEDDIVLHPSNLDMENQNLKGDNNTDSNENGESKTNVVENGIYQEQFKEQHNKEVPISKPEEAETKILKQNNSLKNDSNQNQAKDQPSLNPLSTPSVNGDSNLKDEDDIKQNDSLKNDSNQNQAENQPSATPSVKGESNIKEEDDIETKEGEAKILNRLLSEVPEVEDESVQDIADSNEKAQINGDAQISDENEELKNNEVIDEILDDAESIQETEEESIINDIVNSETKDDNIVSEVDEESKVGDESEATEDSSELLDE